jgi:cytochrome c oxidase subunit III
MGHAATGAEEIHRFETSKMGVWIFLFSEILLFGGLFAAYAVFRSLYLQDFARDHRELDVTLGAINTVVLLCSSLSVALGVASIQRGKTRILQLNLAITIVLGLTFLVIKYFEYSGKFAHGIFPWTSSFFSIYFVMTGLHGLHVLGGIVALSIVLVLSFRGRFSATNYVLVEGTALYWHLVDVVWIYLFPLLYLVA